MYIIIHSSLNFQLSTYLTPGSDVNFMRGTTPWIEEGWRWDFDEVMNDDSIPNMKDWKRLRNQRFNTLIKDKEPLQKEPVSISMDQDKEDEEKKFIRDTTMVC